MTLDEARRILDLDPDADPALHQEELLERREKLIRLMNNAPDTVHADRFRRELAEHDEAVAFLKHYRAPGSTGRRVLTGFLALLLAAGGGGYAFLKIKEENARKTRAEVERLFGEAERLVDSKEWYAAREKYQRIVRLMPDSQMAIYGLNQVEATIEREKQAFLAEWNHEATTAFAAKRWDQAEAAAKTILAKYPEDAGAGEMQQRIAAARKAERIEQSLAAGRAKLQLRDWDGAVASAEAALALEANQIEAKSLRDEAIAARQKAEVDRLKARELFAKAKSADQGQYDKQLVAWAREARALAPDDAEIKALFDKVSAYVRIVRVPGDFATPTEAVADLDDGNVLLLGEGSWQGPLIIDKRVELRGIQAATVIECPASQSVAISFGPGSKGAKVIGLTFRHQDADVSAERFSAALVRGGDVSFQDCVFTQAAGHGLMVIEGGKASVTNGKFTGNGWDGASASGEGSSLEVHTSEASGNGEHGFDVWNGAAGNFTANRCVNNGRNGILLDCGNAVVTATGNHLQGNREFGLVLQSAAQGGVIDNTFEANQLGGLVVRLAASKVEIAKNRFSDVPAIAVEKGVPVDAIRKANELPAHVSIPEFVFPKEDAP
ncbi:MAG TPA: right-handed parallel beta-helix repeat-containing protein [Luteolibacter sp.]